LSGPFVVTFVSFYIIVFTFCESNQIMAGAALFGDIQLLGKEGPVPNDSINDADVIGIYFSAHWCPPCRGFTPVLSETYKKITAAGKKFQVVFVSSDRDQVAFEEYYSEMPFLALPFSESDKGGELKGKYGVRGIPTLILVNNKGETITQNGRGVVMEDQEGAKFPWSA